MAFRIFYSWQSDIDTTTNKDLIQSALQEAINSLEDDILLDAPAEADRDTKDVPGSPDFLATILQKIESASIFLADLTPVAKVIPRLGRSEKMQPNSNVTIEYGHALAFLGEKSIIGVLNEAYGIPDALPSDTRYYVIRAKYSLMPGDANQESKRRTLADILASEIKTIIERVVLQGLSHHAAKLAEYCVKNSPRGRDWEEPWLTEADIVTKLGLTSQQAHDAIESLLNREYVRKRAGTPLMISPRPTLFVTFDKVWTDRNPNRIARSVAKHLLGKESFVPTGEVAVALKLTPRQINPALFFLLESKILQGSSNVDATFFASSLMTTDRTREFVTGEWPPRTRPGLRG